MMEILSLEKLAVKTQSDITRTITRENPNFDGTQSDFEAFGMKPQDYGDGMTDPSEASTFIGGKVLSLAPGEKLESFESARPNTTFNGFIEHLMKDSMAGVLPYEFTIDPTKAGGASVRLIVAKADRIFQHLQNIMIQRMLTPIWGYIIGTAIEEGELPANEYWNKVSWTTPRRITVDAGRDAQQNRLDIESGVKTLTEHYLEQGDDPKKKIRENAAEKAYIKKVAEEFGIEPSAIYKPQNLAVDDVNKSFQQMSEQQMDDGEPVEEADPDDPNVE